MVDRYCLVTFEDTGKQGGHCGITECLRVYGGGAQSYSRERDCYICDECHAIIQSGELHKLPGAPRMTREEVMARLASRIDPASLDKIFKDTINP